MKNLLRIFFLLVVLAVFNVLESSCRKRDTCYICTHSWQSQYGGGVERVKTCDPDEVMQLTYYGNGFTCRPQ